MRVVTFNSQLRWDRPQICRYHVRENNSTVRMRTVPSSESDSAQD